MAWFATTTACCSQNHFSFMQQGPESLSTVGECDYGRTHLRKACAKPLIHPSHPKKYTPRNSRYLNRQERPKAIRTPNLIGVLVQLQGRSSIRISNSSEEERLSWLLWLEIVAKFKRDCMNPWTKKTGKWRVGLFSPLFKMLDDTDKHRQVVLEPLQHY